MRIHWKRLLTTRPVLRIIYWVIRLYLGTIRLKVENEKPWTDIVEGGGRVLLCTWHQQFFAAIRHFRNYRKWHPALMISKSNDGELIAGVASRTGWNPVRGSSSRAGKEALAEMVQCLRKSGLAAHILDGPRGPAGKVKAGAIRLALDSDAVIVPFCIEAENAWYFNSWDRFMVPKPFSRATLRYGDCIRLEPAETEEQFEKNRILLENTMLPFMATSRDPEEKAGYSGNAP
ncbi:MAG: lysophospholipid acyltransferase family protein [Proteobacteria bacterium]|nr:lysophospholipid acyltransferase family protein [Pseudomonadota bacterium]